MVYPGLLLFLLCDVLCFNHARLMCDFNKNMTMSMSMMMADLVSAGRVRARDFGLSIGPGTARHSASL